MVDCVTVAYNAKVAEEKKANTTTKKAAKQKPQMGRNFDNSRNNNPQMVADLMGDEDEYGEEYGEYGDYGEETGTGTGTGGGAKRIPENYDNDFM